MSSLELTSYTDVEFTAAARLDGATIQVVLTGNADINAIEPVTAFLDKLHTESLRLAATQVVVDLQQLEFMNSSCLKSFVSWISSLSETSANQQYKIKFVSNPELRWQRRSLHALSCFASDLVSVSA